ncbi:MAG: hypothetical protein WC998_09525 [Candidatus Paceibacterota bacterium]|jgi:hypothetical protein
MKYKFGEIVKVSSDIQVVIMDEKEQEIKNPYSGVGYILNPLEIAVYDLLKGCERLNNYELMGKCINWFMENNAEAYMILLD